CSITWSCLVSVISCTWSASTPPTTTMTARTWGSTATRRSLARSSRGSSGRCSRCRGSAACTIGMSDGRRDRHARRGLDVFLASTGRADLRRSLRLRSSDRLRRKSVGFPPQYFGPRGVPREEPTCQPCDHRAQIHRPHDEDGPGGTSKLRRREALHKLAALGIGQFHLYDESVNVRPVR